MRLLAAMLVALAGVLTVTCPASAQAAPRNVVLIVADDLGLDLGCFGNTVIKTPNLDALAKQGVRFTQAYTNVASCSPSRSVMYTGLFNHTNGQYGLQHNPHVQQAHSWVQSLPFLLRRAGYFTGIIGKVHVGPAAVYPWEVEIAGKALKGNRDAVAMAKAAREFIDQSGKKPFFLVMGYADPHLAKGFGNEPFAKDPAEVRYDPKNVIVPPHLPDQPEVRAELAEYYQSVSRLDRGVGLLIEVLRAAGQLDNTLIIFISDNGIPFPGAKTTLYAAGLHLPMIVCSPNQKQRGHGNNALVSWIDVAPTILDWTGAKGPKYELPGKSLLPILDEESPKGRDVVFASHTFHEITMYYPMRSIQTRKHKYILNLAHHLEFPFASDLWGSQTWQGVLRRNDKMLGQRLVSDYLKRPREELYDLDTDPHELKNVANNPSHAATLTDLRQRVRAWQRDTSDPWTILYRTENPSENK